MLRGQVLAARDGVVAAFCDHFSEGGPRESLLPRANFVALRHADGTYTRYVQTLLTTPTNRPARGRGSTLENVNFPRVCVQAVSELLAYLASEKAKGAEIVGEDVEDLEDAGRSVLQGIDDFLKLAPREDVLMVERNTKDQAARTAATKSAAPVGRELEGAVVGEGAFVAGARI